MDPSSETAGRGGASAPAAGEHRRVAALALAMALVTAVPYLLARRLPIEGSRFHETLIYESDFNTYCGYVRQAADGRWIFSNPFTPEPHRPAFFSLHFLAAGLLAAASGLDPGAALQWLGAAVGVGLCFALHRLSRHVVSSPRVRLLWLGACLTGGGLGWLTVVPGVAPLARTWGAVDRYAGLHPFFWLFFNPHFVIAGALVALALSFYIDGESGPRPRAHLWAALSALAVGLVRPFDALFLAATAATYAAVAGLAGRMLLSGRTLLRLSLAWGAAPALAYNFWLFSVHPIFRWWGRLNVVHPAAPLGLLVGLGLVLVPFLAALRRIVASRRATTAESVLLAAVGCTLALLYSFPLLSFAFQFVTALLVPLSLLAAGRLDPRWVSRPGLAAALVAALCLNGMTSAVLYARAVREVVAGAHRTPAGLVDAARWLHEHAAAGEVVLAGEKTSNRLPRYSGHAVVAGSPFSTVQYERKREEVRRFYEAGTGDGFRRRMLDRYGVRYVLHGQEERALGAWDPAGSSLLQRAFASGDVTLYRAVPPGDR
jgi:hypothetical protein